MKPTDMNVKFPITNRVPAIKPNDEQFFIDRLVEILIMQAETDERKNKYKDENNRICKNV